MTNFLYGICTTSWRGFASGGIKVHKLDFALTGFRVRCFSARQPRRKQLPKVDHKSSMEDERNAFYVVRKGDIVGIYRNLSDCQAQVGSSVCDPSVSVYKGYNLRKETEEYLASRGLKDPVYTINAGDAKEDLFGALVPCPFQQPDTSLHDRASKKLSTLKRSKDMEAVGSGSNFIEHSKKHLKLGNAAEIHSAYRNNVPCILEFDGASKGNPGKAGAGAILRYEDGSVICRLRESLGVATNNVAEYRALILGLKHALKKGFMQIRAQGDSKLVCMQVNDQWQARNENMANLCKEVKGLKDLFRSFSISHVLREFNSDADAQANLAIDLSIGEVAEDSG